MYDQKEHTISRSNILYGCTNDDVWFNLDQFYRDQIQEVNQKLTQLDDDIWGKIVLMEKNKRVAKAYLRTPRFRVDGSAHEFDGQRLGFKSLANVSRDPTVEEIRNKIGVVLMKMDQQGNIIAKRCEGSSPIIVQGAEYPHSYCHGAEVTQSRGRLEPEKAVRIFDIRAFKAGVERELAQPYPDRKKLLYKSAVRISLVKNESHPFKTPCWFMVINIVALDMLNANVPALPSIVASVSETPVGSRCVSVSPDFQPLAKHLSISNIDLYSTLSSMARSQFAVQPVARIQEQLAPSNWSETYDDPAAHANSDSPDSDTASVSVNRFAHAPNPPAQLLTAQLANSLALGYTSKMIAGQQQQRWCSSMARSMDCLYSKTNEDELDGVEASFAPNARSKNQQQPQRQQQESLNDNPKSERSASVSLASKQKKLSMAANSCDADLEIRTTTGSKFCAPVQPAQKSPPAGLSDGESSTSSSFASSVSSSSLSSSWIAAGPRHDRESSDSSSVDASHGSDVIPQRPSCSSLPREPANDTVNFGANATVESMTSPRKPNSTSRFTAKSEPLASSTLGVRNRSASAASPRTTPLVAAPDPPPRPRSLFRNAIKSKLFSGFQTSIFNGHSSSAILPVSEKKRAALARYNNIQLENGSSTSSSFCSTSSISYDTSLDRKFDGRFIMNDSNERIASCDRSCGSHANTVTTEAEVYRL